MSEEIKLCPKCGAEVNDLNIKCPYCGFYNDELALKQEKSEMDALRTEHETVMKNMPRDLVRKHRLRMFVIIAAVIVFIILAAVVGTFLYNKMNSFGYHNKQEFLAHLEEMYQNGEYDELFDEYYNSSYHGSSYGKYENTADVAMERHYAIEDLKYSKEYPDKDSINSALKKSFRCLYLAQNMRDKGFIYGEKDAVEKLEAEMISLTSPNSYN